ncbi:BTAD domain-containing putative transcriptional regulator [Nocardia bovistercoris]|uniref:AAA family ATPase n=1 Tax=Nocardia bovistercoris TaxID=2785916 RepID=A0A931I8K6_9NOCA|nr:BTAD domain-containing putative transcriptional regulator [Nocardia bovistercoris]MBH0776291.1 AAA family ATPase [Nocardia bovistercoris]
MVRIGVLGALTAADERGELDLGGPRQRGVLARLLVARGEVVPVDRLIDDLWRGEPPPRALGALQAYVSNLRRLLEPARAPRTPATVLISRTPGYAVCPTVADVDAWRFVAEVEAAAGQEDPRERRRTLERALARWHGPAYAAFSAEPWATAEAARLEELRLGAREQLAAALLELDEPALAAAEAEVLSTEHPLREEAWRLTALAQYRAGRQADALAALRRARAVLADELGIDPGPALTRLEADILAQRIPLPEKVIRRPQAAVAPPAEGEPEFFGRTAELDSLRVAASGSGPRSATVAGEAGSGKSTLLHHFAAELRSGGYRVVIGRCPEDDAAPSAWPWVEILRVLAREHDPGAFGAALAPLLTDGVGAPDADRAHGRFLMHRAVCDYLAEVADRAPLAVLLDDLHRADAETAALLTAVAGRVPALVLIGYRPDEAPPPLADALAALATTVRARIRLRGLAVEDSARLIGALTGDAPTTTVVRTLHERTGGNPFYLVEVARLLRSEGEVVAASDVPQGVRDVLRRRLSRLPETAVALLRLAAVIGREFEVAVLVRAAEVSEDDVLDAVEAGVLAGLLDEPGGGRARFTHVMVRDTLLGDLSRIRRDRWHRRIARALEELAPGDVAALAHHYGESVTADTARRAADYAVAAAERAERRYAHDVAASNYERAVAALERDVVADTVTERVDLLCLASRAHLAGGAGQPARSARRRAAALADDAGRVDLLVRVFTAWDSPTPWVNRMYGVAEHEVVDWITDALRFPDLTAADRCRLLVTFADEIGGVAEERAAAAAAEAEVLARALGDDDLLAPALQARASLYACPDRGPLGAELIELGRRRDRKDYLLLGHTVSIQAAASEGDIAAVREHLSVTTALADRYQWRQAQVANTMTAGLAALASGDPEAAERHYLAAGELTTRAGILNPGGILAMALFVVRMHQGRLGELAEMARAYAESAAAETADTVVDFQVLALLAAGDRDEAARARQRGRPIRDDLFRSLFLTMRGMVVAELGTRAEAATLYRELLPWRDRLGGADTGSYAVGPVDTVLGDLAARGGDRALAAEHYLAALRMARRCGNPTWSAQATRRLES